MMTKPIAMRIPVPRLRSLKFNNSISKEAGFFEGMATSRSRAGNVQNEPDTSCQTRKQRNYQGIISKGFKNLKRLTLVTDGII